MRKCQYSGRICRAEELLDKINPGAKKELVEKFCLGNKEECDQYREIEDSGIGFCSDVLNLLESASSLYERITKRKE